MHKVPVLASVGSLGPAHGPVWAGERDGMGWFVPVCTALLCDLGLVRGGSAGGHIGRPGRPIPA